LSQKKQSEDVLKLNFILDSFVDFKIGDYIIFEKNNVKYKLNSAPKIIQTTAAYEYFCVFEGPIHDFPKTKVMLTTNKPEGGFYIDYYFTLTGNASSFLTFIVENLNKNGGNYVVGNSVNTEMIPITFNNWNVYEALFQISEQLQIPWYLGPGNTLHFTNQEYTTGYLFQTARKAGIYQLSKNKISGVSLITKVWAFGASKNLPPRINAEGSTYNSILLTDNRLIFAGEGGLPVITKNIDKYGIIESIQEFNEIYPKRTGVVTSIDPTNPFIFTDSTMDFNINDYLLTGIIPKVHFTTGLLVGFDFPIVYDNNTKQFTLTLISDNGVDYPNIDFKCLVGDNYVLIDLIMPTTYITAAEQELRQAAQEYLDMYSSEMFYFEAELEAEYIEANAIILDLGSVIRVVSSAFTLDELFEIKELSQSLINTFEYRIKFGNVIPKNLLGSLRISNFNMKQQITTIEKSATIINQTSELVWQTL